jgi:hypothetical protein
MVMATLFSGQAFADQMRCSFSEDPPVSCSFTDRVAPDGTHQMIFNGGGRRMTFVGKSQTGWWSGKLDGKPAMGYERNRGNVVLSSVDLSTRFAWWYPADEHGNY